MPFSVSWAVPVGEMVVLENLWGYDSANNFLVAVDNFVQNVLDGLDKHIDSK